MDYAVVWQHAIKTSVASSWHFISTYEYILLTYLMTYHRYHWHRHSKNGPAVRYPSCFTTNSYRQCFYSVHHEEDEGERRSQSADQATNRTIQKS